MYHALCVKFSGPGMLLLAIMPVGSGATAQVLERPVLSVALQQGLAQKVRDTCKREGYDVAVAIASADGVPRTLLSGDATDALSIDSALRKAHIAAKLGFPTALLTKAATEAPAYVEFLRSIEPQLILLGGGVPIRVRGVVAGAIGVGGSPRPEADEVCANAALAAMAYQLK